MELGTTPWHTRSSAIRSPIAGNQHSSSAHTNILEELGSHTMSSPVLVVVAVVSALVAVVIVQVYIIRSSTSIM